MVTGRVSVRAGVIHSCDLVQNKLVSASPWIEHSYERNLFLSSGIDVHCLLF